MATYPIWKDVGVSIPNGQLYRVSGGTDELGQSGVFFQGRAVKPDGVGNATVYYNRICAARMKYGAPTPFTLGVSTCCQPQSFSIERSSDGSTWINVSTDTFLPDWSYLATPASIYKGARINDHFHPQMILFYTATGSTTVNLFINRGNGNVNVTSESVTSAGGTVIFPLTSATPPFKSAGIGSYVWATLNDCARYALYYRNAFGGWDSFLIEGSVTESTDPTRWTRRIEAANNTTPIPRMESNYASEIVRRWSCETGWLTDDESSRMWHLLESTDVWIHDFAQDRILPVVIDEGYQFKNRRNQGRKLVKYTIACHLATDRIRM